MGKSPNPTADGKCMCCNCEQILEQDDLRKAFTKNTFVKKLSVSIKNSDYMRNKNDYIYKKCANLILEREPCVVFACLLDLLHQSSPICSSVRKCMYARLASASAFTTFSSHLLAFKLKYNKERSFHSQSFSSFESFFLVFNISN